MVFVSRVAALAGSKGDKWDGRTGFLGLRRIALVSEEVSKK